METSCRASLEGYKDVTLEMQLPVLSLNMTKFADVHPTLRQVVVRYLQP